MFHSYEVQNLFSVVVKFAIPVDFVLISFNALLQHETLILSTFTLHLQQCYYYYIIDPPKFLTHPSNSSVELGGEVTLECNAFGDPLPTFKWYKDSNPMVETDDINPFLPELVLKDAVTQDEAWYFCEATNVAGTVRSNSASLKVFGE